MEAHPKQVTPTKAKKRIVQKHKWKRNIKKADRYEPRGPPEPPTCSHNKGAFLCQSLRQGDIGRFHNIFYSNKNKVTQDSFILKHVNASNPRRQRKKKNINRKKRPFDRSRTTTYFITRQNRESVPVCKQTFMKILQITPGRLRGVVNRFFKTNSSPVEKRGGDRKSKKNKKKVECIIEFIKRLNCSEAHYCRSKSGSKRYLPSDLNINKLYRMFCNIDPRNQDIKKWLFRRTFNTKFNLSFKTPQTDVCSTCCELTERIKLSEGKEKLDLMIEKRVHKLKADAFYSLLKEERDDLIIFSFDCQKNQTLPKLPDQSVYYSRQLYIYNFLIVVGNSKSSLNQLNCFAYTCTEEMFSKDSNLIASGVYHRLCKTDFDEAVRIVRLVADGCGGQNKNTILITMCAYWLLKKAPNHIQTVELIFPMVGHSFLPADRVFGNIEKRIKVENVIVDPEEYMDIYRQNTTVVKFGDECPVLNWKEESTLYMKPPGSWHFPFAKSKRFYIQRSFQQSDVIVRGECHYRTDLGKLHKITKKNMSASMIDPFTILPDQVMVNPLKIKDVKKLLIKHYGPNWRDHEKLSFYNRFFPENDQEDESVDNNQALDDNAETFNDDVPTDLECQRVEEVETLVV